MTIPYSRPGPYRRLLKAAAIGAVLLATVCWGSALAGPYPMPLIVHLDLADYVVLGKIVAIEELGNLDGKRGDDTLWGRATVEVRETLKGQKAEKVTFLVATGSRSRVEGPYGAASPPQAYKVGDEGIWVTCQDRDERVVSHSWGLLRESQLKEVKQLLKELENRQWNDAVGGLRVWAGVTETYGARQVVVFCVKNVTDKDIYGLRDINVGLLSASAEDEAGRAQSCDLYRDRTPDKDRPPAACVLKPGAIMYLHPDYSWIDVGRNLAPGKYRVTVSMSNEVPKGRLYHVRDAKEDVPLWTGRICANPVTVAVPEKKAR